jgi:3-hydroxyisobutyrate dehydrogenase/2-hydroxy-3-oxopropionate reductase
MSTVAFLGLGAMGSRMARRLLDAGHQLTVWNRSPEKAQPLVEAGAKPAKTPAEASRSVEAVITMVADPSALQAVTEGPEGIASSVGPSSTVIEMSTVGPAAIERLRSVLPPETALLDAPVLGSLNEAGAGSLQVFVGGRDDLVDRWRPLFSALGTPMHVGPLGAGASAKLVANSTLLGVLSVLGEALALAEGLGLSRDVAFDVLAQGPLAAQAERRRRAVEAGEYPLHFALSLGRKDAEVIAEEAASSGVELRALEAAGSWFADAERAGWGDRDYSAILAWILTRGGNDPWKNAPEESRTETT